MHLRTYLSSRHHPEPYVKGGYIQFDKLDFISEGFLGDFMKYATIKIGHMENNYGDAHFRRSDNSSAIYNPFVGNLIMDGFTTEVGAELYYQNNGWLAMLGFTNGKLNQGVDNPDTGGASFLAKFGYDKQISEDFRFRLTGSMYNTGAVRRSYLYSADRTGSRYYLVLETLEETLKDRLTKLRYLSKWGSSTTSSRRSRSKVEDELWSRIQTIAIGIARGMEYLSQEKNIVVRDLVSIAINFLIARLPYRSAGRSYDERYSRFSLI